MAKFSRKRKLVINDIIDLSDNELVESSCEDSDVEIVEKHPKIQHVDLSISQNSNLEISSEGCTVEDNVDVVEISSDKVGLERASSSEDLFNSQDVVFIGPQFSKTSEKEEGDKESGYNSLTSSLDVFSDTKTSCRTQSQGSESNTDFCVLNSEIQGNRKKHNIKQKLLELEEEVQKLKAENDCLRLKSCVCNKQCGAVNSTLEDLIATVAFNRIEDYNTYKNQVLTLFQPALKFEIIEKESDRVIEIFRDILDADEWVVISDSEVLPKEKTKKNKHKKKKKRVKQNADLFMLDTTPFVETNNKPQYESKFSVTLSKSNNQGEQKVNGLSNCFNCDENHNLRDCPHPKNFSKISAARQKLKAKQNKLVRYHLEEEQKFGHLKPGIISAKLRRALGLRDDQLPLHIYKMRQLGYPPGWFEVLLETSHSNLLLFDFEGKNDSKAKIENAQIDSDKIVEYSGFNVPIERGIRDEYRQHGCNPYSKECSKYKMLEYARKMSQKAKDNLESCDMDIDDPTSPKTSQNNSPFTPVQCSSPTLNELESAKVKLLSELVDAGDDSISNSIPAQEENSDCTKGDLLIIDVTGATDDLNTTLDQSQSDPQPNLKSVKVTMFGTPVLSSLSPFSKLPKPENFQQNVSDVINFENLPDCTGKYEQIVSVLDKVRKQMKMLNRL